MPTTASSGKSRVILELMNFGPDPSRGGRVTDLAEFKSALDLFQEFGYNEPDTARSYIGGKQESFTKAAGWKERGMTIATKVYPAPAGTHRAEVITKRFEASLMELGTDCVDVSFSTPTNSALQTFENLTCQVAYLHAAVSIIAQELRHKNSAI